MTPEGRVKNSISKLLETYKIYPASKAGAFPENARGWYYCPGQSGFGVSGIPDFIGCFSGAAHTKARFFGIEAKAPGKAPTGFQKLQIEAIKWGGAKCFVVDGKDTLDDVRVWLDVVLLETFTE